MHSNNMARHIRFLALSRLPVTLKNKQNISNYHHKKVSKNIKILMLLGPQKKLTDRQSQQWLGNHSHYRDEVKETLRVSSLCRHEKEAAQKEIVLMTAEGKDDRILFDLAKRTELLKNSAITVKTRVFYHSVTKAPLPISRSYELKVA